MDNLKTVWVVSWVYWDGAAQGGGGFWWFPTREEAEIYFRQEHEGWGSHPHRVRLVEITVPDFPTEQEITDWIDSDIDMVEDHKISPAIKVAIAGGVTEKGR